MSTTLSEQWLYPPNWDGNPPDHGGWRTVTKRFTAIIDDATGVEETSVHKVDISDLRTTTGAAVTRTSVMDIKFSQSGYGAITLEWDRAPESTIYIIGDHQGEIEFAGGLPDPSEDGDRTGDILLTTQGAANGNAYDITITLKLKG